MIKNSKKSPQSHAFKLTQTDIIPIVLWVTIVFLTWFFMHGADPYLQLTPQALGKYFEVRYVLIIHITTGGGALVIGGLQFWHKLQVYSWKLHRTIGLLYLLTILISSICAIILATTTAYQVNWAYAFSMQVWVSIWISSTFMGYYTALKNKFKLHEEWMTRSYILTLSFIIFGLLYKMPIVGQLGSFNEVIPVLLWTGWAVPLYLYELVRVSKRA